MATFNRGLDPQFAQPIDPDDDRGTVANFGLFLGGAVQRMASFRSELTIKMWNQKYEYQRGLRTGIASARLFGIQIPALLELRSKGGLRFIMGPALELSLSGSSEASTATGASTTQGALSTDINDDLRTLRTCFIIDAGYAFKKGLAIAFRADVMRPSIWKKDSGRSPTDMNDLCLTLEFDINALSRLAAKKQ
jgi:hypothetical protein